VVYSVLKILLPLFHRACGAILKIVLVLVLVLVFGL